jgi:hypothetical protein
VSKPDTCELERACGTLWNLCSNVRALSFIRPRGACTLSGVPIGGPGNILNNVHIGTFSDLDPEIFLVSLRAYLPSGFGLVPSC